MTSVNLFSTVKCDAFMHTNEPAAKPPNPPNPPNPNPYAKSQENPHMSGAEMAKLKATTKATARSPPAPATTRASPAPAGVRPAAAPAGQERGRGRNWDGGLGVEPDTEADVLKRRELLFASMLGSYKIHSLSRINAILKLYPELRPLADSMMSKWSGIRERALLAAVDSLRHPTDTKKRNEFYRHIASTRLPSIDLVLALRAHLLVARSLSLEDAKEIAKTTQTRQHDNSSQQLADDVITAVAQQLVADSEAIADIATGAGLDLGPDPAATPATTTTTPAEPTPDAKTNAKGTNVDAKEDHVNAGGAGAKGGKVRLGAEDRLQYGWLAVQALDGGQRLVLVEIAGIKDAAKPCAVCKKSCTKRCASCNVAFYCSGDCQSAHWQSEHKEKCVAAHKAAMIEIRTILAKDFHPIVITCPPPQNPSPPKKKITRTKRT